MNEYLRENHQMSLILKFGNLAEVMFDNSQGYHYFRLGEGR